jgi:hypothetical protein
MKQGQSEQRNRGNPRGETFHFGFLSAQRITRGGSNVLLQRNMAQVSRKTAFD